MKQKRLVTIQDISCFGKCSLTVALPVISAMDIECAIVPTAILSTHTGGFSGYTFRDLTEDIDKIAAHWLDCGLSFDAIYTGYLGSGEQLKIVGEFFDKFKTDTGIIFVDPVMADNGKMYAGFPPDFAEGMARLCGKADIIVPNLTEAAFMLGEPYVASGYDEEYIHGLLHRLVGLGCKTAVVTGVSYSPEEQGAVAYDSRTDSFCEYFSENIPAAYHGTGDTFSSALVGALTKGMDMEKALGVAVEFTVAAIKATVSDKSHWYGVRFEDCLGMLTR